jgi:hypothetical protein
VANEDLADFLRESERRKRPYHGGQVRFVRERGGYSYFEVWFDTLD